MTQPRESNLLALLAEIERRARLDGVCGNCQKTIVFKSFGDRGAWWVHRGRNNLCADGKDCNSYRPTFNEDNFPQPLAAWASTKFGISIRVGRTYVSDLIERGLVALSGDGDGRLVLTVGAKV